jgi:CBS domain-containing protein
MKLKEIMTRSVETVHPSDTLQFAARKMRDYDIGFIPVCDGDHILGVVSDRDLAVRALAEGRDPSTLIGKEFLTAPVMYCYEDQDVNEAAQLMRDNQIRRLVVLDRDKQLVGVVSLGDLAVNETNDFSGEILQSVSEPIAVPR